MYQRLVVNGCSYMEAYAQGNGHKDLAQKLNIPHADSLAIGGSANTRIIRTTLKDSYQTNVPTFYVLGMTFLSRLEIPILENQSEFEGRWTNPQNQQFVKNWQYNWTQKDTDQFVELKLKSEVFSILDRVEDLMYKILTAISDLHLRGHQVLIYQQADNLYQQYLDDPRLKLFNSPNIIDGYAWRSVPWQHSQGVKSMNYSMAVHHVPPEMEHPAAGAHETLNLFLVEYIKQHNLLHSTTTVYTSE